MSPDEKDAVIAILKSHRLMTLATNRPDGWPQATIVAYVNDGIELFCFVARLSQKHANIVRDSRVSVAIGAEFNDPGAIKGLSLAGQATILTSAPRYQEICDLLVARFPEYANWGKPDPGLSPVVHIAPKIISMIDYSKGFGHSQLLEVGGPPAPAQRGLFHNWFGGSR